MSDQILFNSILSNDTVYINPATKDSNLNEPKFTDIFNKILIANNKIQDNINKINQLYQSDVNQYAQLYSIHSNVDLLFLLFEKNQLNIQLNKDSITTAQNDIEILKNKPSPNNNHLNAQILELQTNKVNYTQFLEQQDQIELNNFNLTQLNNSLVSQESRITETESQISSLESQMIGSWIATGLEFVLYQSQLIALEVFQSTTTTALTAMTASIAALQTQITTLASQNVIENLVGDVIEQVIPAVSNSVWTKIGSYFKDNWLSIIGTLFGSTTATASLAKSDRLFEILTVDCLDETGLYYVDISQNIKMPTHDITAQSIHGAFGQIDNYDSLFNVYQLRLNNIIEILYQLVGVVLPPMSDIPTELGKQAAQLENIIEQEYAQELNTSLTSLQNSLNMINTTQGQHATTLTTMGNDIYQHDLLITNALNKNNSQDTLITGLQNSVWNAEYNITNLQNTQINQTSQINTLNTNVNSINTVNNTQTNQISTLTTNQTTLTTTQNTHATAINTNTSNISSLTSSVNSMTTAINNLTNSVNSINTSITNLQTKVNSERIPVGRQVILCIAGSNFYTYGNMVFIRQNTEFNGNDYPDLRDYVGENRAPWYNSGKAGWDWYFLAKYLN